MPIKYFYIFLLNSSFINIENIWNVFVSETDAFHTQVFWWLALLFQWFMSVSGPMPYCLSPCVRVYSVVSDSATPRTVAHQDPLSMGFARPEYWSGLPFPPPVDLPDPGIDSPFLHWQALCWATGKAPSLVVQWLRLQDFHSGCAFNPWLGNQESHMPCGRKRKKRFEWYIWTIYMIWASLVAQMACNAGDAGSIPG